MSRRRSKRRRSPNGCSSARRTKTSRNQGNGTVSSDGTVPPTREVNVKGCTESTNPVNVSHSNRKVKVVPKRELGEVMIR